MLPVQKIWNFSKVPTKSRYFSTIKRPTCIPRKYSGSLEVPFYNLFWDAQINFSSAAYSKEHTLQMAKPSDCWIALIYWGIIANPYSKLPLPAEWHVFRRSGSGPDLYRDRCIQKYSVCSGRLPATDLTLAPAAEKIAHDTVRGVIVWVNVVCAMAIIFISLSLEDEDSKIFLTMEWNDCAQTLENNPQWLILMPWLPAVLLVLWRASYS